MADNLHIKGIESDVSRGRRSKSRGKQRKPYIIDCIFPVLSFLNRERESTWEVWGRYRTESARDQAYTTLVKKAAVFWGGRWEYRKRKEINENENRS